MTARCKWCTTQGDCPLTVTYCADGTLRVTLSGVTIDVPRDKAPASFCPHWHNPRLARQSATREDAYIANRAANAYARLG